MFRSSYRIWKHSEQQSLGHRKPKKYATIWITQHKCNSLVCCACQWCGKSTYYQYWPVNGADYYEMLDRYIRSEVQQFAQNSICRRDGPSSHNTHAFRSPLISMSQNPLTGSYGLRGWPARSHNLSPQTFSSVELWRFNCIGFLCLAQATLANKNDENVNCQSGNTQQLLDKFNRWIASCHQRIWWINKHKNI